MICNILTIIYTCDNLITSFIVDKNNVIPSWNIEEECVDQNYRVEKLANKKFTKITGVLAGFWINPILENVVVYEKELYVFYVTFLSEKIKVTEGYKWSQISELDDKSLNLLKMVGLGE